MCTFFELFIIAIYWEDTRVLCIFNHAELFGFANLSSGYLRTYQGKGSAVNAKEYGGTWCAVAV